MPITFQCPHCRLAFSLPDQMAGKQAKCKCGQQLTIPPGNAAATASTALPQRAAPQPTVVSSSTAAQVQPMAQMTTSPVATPPNIPQFNTAGLWQAGNLLVMSKQAQLPTHLCIRTGAPAAMQRTEQLRWVPGWVAFTLFAGRIVHYAVSESHGRRCTVRFGISSGVNLFRILPLIIGYTVVGIGVCGFVGNLVWMFTFHQEGDPIPTVGFLLGGLIGAVGAFITLLGGNVLAATAMDEQFVVICGVSPQLLAALPAWPGPVPKGTSA